jgi:carbon-monoxide dehydrogenase small subunit
MQIVQQFVVTRPRPVVWDYFGQIEKVTLCMPGASLAEPVSGDKVKFKFNAKLGPINAAFVGDAELKRDPENFIGLITGSGRDSRGNSQAKGTLEYRLTDESNGYATRVDVTTNFSLTGSLAQFGRSGLIKDLAERITKEFAINIEAALAEEARRTQFPSRDDPHPGPSTSRSTPREIGITQLVFSVLFQRVKKFFRRMLGRQVD